MVEMRRKCRIWWPKQLSKAVPSSSSNFSLLGWSVSSSDSVDFVVASAFSECGVSGSHSSLQEIVHDINAKMPVSLQNKAGLSVLGHCVAVLGRNQLLEKDDKDESLACGTTSALNSLDGSKGSCGSRRCRFYSLDGVLDQCRQDFFVNSFWVLLTYDSHEKYGKEICWIPRLHHIHWTGGIVSQCDVHVIVYEDPIYGSHHFSLCNSDSSKPEAVLIKPIWLDKLHQKQPLIDLDTVILAINCATAAKMHFQGHVGARRFSLWFSVFHMFFSLISHVWAVSVASLSTVLYIILQFLHTLLSYGSQSWIYVLLEKMLSATWTNIRVHCSQILYWPITLQDKSIRSQSCVEYAEKTMLHKHSMWSSFAVDVLLGNLLGFTLLYNAESTCLCVSDFANNVTNMLRSGCVWLMGVPAGFKLNTELAGVLGMISLNAIQIWSAIWILVAPFLIYFIKGLALSGIVFGVTMPASLIMDMIACATLHVSTLHWLISLLYSIQIQALASTWRLFRGRKWNPLRQRLDSYNYDVEQHIVGSLLFTPLFLLLPTTTIFYIFFSMLQTNICAIRMLIEATISIVHATPYFKILCWLVSRRRFPSGIWFEVLSCCSNDTETQCATCHDDIISPTQSRECMNSVRGKRYSVVSILCSNFLNIGHIVLPHYRNVFSSVPGSFVATSAYGILSGRGVPSNLGTGLPSTMPWMSIPCKEYWRLCHDSVLACSRS